MENDKGFSLIELLIVVAIILILAAITVPNLIKSRMAANEGSATASIRAICTSQTLYKASQGGFAGSLSTLASEGYIDNVLGSGTKSGYVFVTSPLSGSESMAFTAEATPQVTGSLLGTGKRYFYTDQTQVIRFEIGQAAASNSKAID
jgi:type IV pilus assembly protein PilA